MPPLSPSAPSISVSSDIVTSSSRFGCSNESSSRIASPIATAIPLSAPSVVFFAFIKSSSTIISIGSFEKS